MTKMALDEISPFRPRWNEERAFKRLYFQWANSKVLHFRECLKLVDVDVPSYKDRRIMWASYNEAAAKIASNGELCHDTAQYASWKKQNMADNR